MEKDLSLICVGYRNKDGSSKYEYKHRVNWINLECSEDEYDTNIPHTVINEDGTIKEKFYLKMTTKELIYNELREALISIYYDKKDKKDLQDNDKTKLKELILLKKYYEKYTNRDNTIRYVNKDFDKSIVSDTYDYILKDIILQINRIEKKKIKRSDATLRKECFKNITALLKKDYTEQKNFYNQKEKELKEKIKKRRTELEDTSQLNQELQKIKRIKRERNLQNYREKAKIFLYENGINVDDKH